MKKKPRIVRVIRSKKGRRRPEYIGAHKACDGMRYKIVLCYNPILREAAFIYLSSGEDMRKFMTPKWLSKWMDFPYEA
jgi:hypothetical protein